MSSSLPSLIDTFDCVFQQLLWQGPDYLSRKIKAKESERGLMNRRVPVGRANPSTKGFDGDLDALRATLDRFLEFEEVTGEPLSPVRVVATTRIDQQKPTMFIHDRFIERLRRRVDLYLLSARG
jgi:hypothetical protein